MLLALPLALMFSGCLGDEGDTVVIPELHESTPESMLPAYLYDSLSRYVAIHNGNTPPNIEGEYKWSPVLLEYASDDDLPSSFSDVYMKFSNQSSRNLCTYYEEQGTAVTRCDSTLIVGHDNVFTLVGIMTSVNNQRNTKSVIGTLVSGRMTPAGITDYSYAIYMIDKVDPDNHLMAVGEFRIFYDGDGLVEKYSWYSSKAKAFLDKGNVGASLTDRKEVSL